MEANRTPQATGGLSSFLRAWVRHAYADSTSREGRGVHGSEHVVEMMTATP